MVVAFCMGFVVVAFCESLGLFVGVLLGWFVGFVLVILDLLFGLMD